MAVDASRVTISSSYVLLVAHPLTSSNTSADVENVRYLLKNVTGTAGLYIGSPTDPSGDRFFWEPLDGLLSIDLEPGEAVWAVSAGADQIIHTIRNGR